MSKDPATNAALDSRVEPIDGLEEQVRALKTELSRKDSEIAQKDLLLKQGFEAFTEAAENLQASHKRLQQKVAELNLELEDTNKELAKNLVEKEKVKTYLSNIFESLDTGVLVTDLEGGITSVNRTGIGLLGASSEGLAGSNVNEVLDTQLIPMTNADRGNNQQELEEPLPFHRSDGESLLLQVSVSRMIGDDARPLGYILNVQDVTLLKKLEEHAGRRNRFTTMGEMAANMAHEIRNPLGSIELFTSLLRKGMEGDGEKLALMNHISAGIVSMNHIISNLLEYSKPRAAKLERLDLHEVLQELVDFHSFRAAQNQVELIGKLSEGSIWIKGDPELLKQVFHNLLLNGMQAMAEGGKLILTTRQRTVTSRKLLKRLTPEGEKPPEKMEVAEISVKDTGSGMPKDIQRQIFDPFFTTKDRGTGLGLAIVHSIVEAHKGVIDVESEVDKGTTFLLMFPMIS